MSSCHSKRFQPVQVLPWPYPGEAKVRDRASYGATRRRSSAHRDTSLNTRTAPVRSGEAPGHFPFAGFSKTPQSQILPRPAVSLDSWADSGVNPTGVGLPQGNTRPLPCRRSRRPASSYTYAHHKDLPSAMGRWGG